MSYRLCYHVYMNKIIKVELDRMEQEAFEVEQEQRDAEFLAHDDYTRYVEDMEQDAWLDWWTEKNYNLVGQ